MITKINHRNIMKSGFNRQKMQCNTLSAILFQLQNYKVLNIIYISESKIL